MFGNRRGFTLLELLVVMGIIAVLLAILLPALEKSTERARITACSSNLHQIAIGLTAYGNDFNNQIPVGPSSASAVSPARTWNTIGNNQLWIANLSKYNGMGVLVTGAWLADARVFVCPSDADATLKLLKAFNDFKSYKPPATGS